MSQNSHPTPLLYVGIVFCLFVGTVVTYFAATIDMGMWNPVVALTIACTKAVLVVLFFMHVHYSDKLTKVTVVAGLFWLMILITLSLSDYIGRSLPVAH
jgi:cytochrome c oxidase subunit 4